MDVLMIKKIYAILRSLFWAAICRIVPKRKNLIVVGGWNGNIYNDNSRFFAEYVKSTGRFDVYWVGNEIVRGKVESRGIRFSRRGSLHSLWLLLRARCFVCCQGLIDLTDLPLAGGFEIVNLWHGICFKLSGARDPNAVNESADNTQSLVKILWRRFFAFMVPIQSCWTSVASASMGDVLPSCLGFFGRDKVLPYGTPRNDFLIASKNNKELTVSLKKKYAGLLGFDEKKKVVLYMPTYRRTKSEIFSFYSLNGEGRSAWREMLNTCDAVLIEKHHYETYKKVPIDSSVDSCSIVVPSSMQSEIDVQEMLLITDLLITDYSTVFFDYSLLEKPCIHFAYDYEYYANSDSGVAYELKDVAAGKIVETSAECLEEARAQLRRPNVEKGPMLESLLEYEKGHASERILKYLEENLI